MKIIINILRFNLKANKLEIVAETRTRREGGFQCCDEAGAIVYFIKHNDKPLMAKAIFVCVDYHT